MNITVSLILEVNTMKTLFSLSLILTLFFTLLINNFAYAQELVGPRVLQPAEQSIQ